jgi:hypothetical protein
MGILASVLNIPINDIGKHVVANRDFSIRDKGKIIEAYGGIRNLWFVYDKFELEYYWHLFLENQ